MERPSSELRIIGDNYTSAVEQVEPGVFYFERQHFWPQNKTQLDVFANCWSLAIIDAEKFKIGYERSGMVHWLHGKVGILIPRFSVIKWHMGCDFLKWHAYISQIEIPDYSPRGPFAFRWSSGEHPQNLADIKDILESVEEWESIGLSATSAYSKKLKELIDHRYADRLSLQQMAAQVCCSPESLIRFFKKDFSITPIQYRLKLRLSDAVMLLMSRESNVNRIASELGFNDLSFFNKIFKREMNATPSSYQIGKRSFQSQPQISL